MVLQKTYLAQNMGRLKPFRAKKSGPAIAGPAGPPKTALFKESLDDANIEITTYGNPFHSGYQKIGTLANSEDPSGPALFAKIKSIFRYSTT